jgi:hypothetical protein
MRKRMIRANERVRIAVGRPVNLYSDLDVFAQVLDSVGLTLEVGPAKMEGSVILYAVRRAVSHDGPSDVVTLPAAVAEKTTAAAMKAAAMKAG